MRIVAKILSILFGVVFVVFVLGYAQIVFMVSPFESPIVIPNTIEYDSVVQYLIGRDLLSVVVCLVCLLLSSYFYSYSHRLSTKKKGIYEVENIDGPFVLYLRSFIDDKKTRMRISFADYRAEEEELVDVLSDIAPVYAIGDPKDTKMPIGASRIYVSDEMWKSAVFNLASKAELVVLRLGATDSFWWEVEMAVKNVPIERVLFVIPECNSFDNIAMLFKILLDNGIDISKVKFDTSSRALGSIASFLFFSTDKTPQTSPLKEHKFTKLFISYNSILRKALYPIRSRYGLNITKLKVRKARVLSLIAGLYVVFIAGLQFYVDYNGILKAPNELTVECVKYSSFVEKYSDAISGDNLLNACMETQIGLLALDSEKYLFLFEVELLTLELMSDSELSQCDNFAKLLLMIKKYVPEQYIDYLRLCAESVNMSIENPEYIEALYDYYRNIPHIFNNDMDMNVELYETLTEQLGKETFAVYCKAAYAQNRY